MAKISTFSARLRQALERSGLTQTELARRSEVSKSSISHYLKGDWEAKQDAIYALARAAGVRETWLMGYDVPPEREGPPADLIRLGPMEKIPLLGKIACGTPILAEENIQDYIDLPGHIHADFALTCQGESMVDAGIRSGDVVYIRSQDSVENGQIAAVRVGDDEATLKRFYRDGEVLQLIAANPIVRPMVFYGEEMNQVHVIGLAVAYTHVLE